MTTHLTVKNYRCFSDSSPLHLDLSPGDASLVGANNVGKSTILKFFFEFRQLFRLLAEDSSALGIVLSGAAVNIPHEPANVSLDEIFCNGNERPLVVLLRLEGAPTGSQPPVLDKIEITVNRGGFVAKARGWSGGPEIPRSKDVAVEIRKGTLRYGEQVVANVGAMQGVCQLLANTMYVGPFRHVLNASHEQAHFDLEVGRNFIAKWRKLRTGTSKSSAQSVEAVTREVEALLGFSQLSITENEMLNELQLMEGGKHYFLREVGSGVAEIVVVLMQVAMRRPTLLLIDEPELHLHPAMQVKFMRALSAYCSFGILFATHSLALARTSSRDVYSVLRTRSGGTEVRPLSGTARLPELLGEMGLAQYRELGCDKLLLVEGVTDVKVFQEFLRLWGKDGRVCVLSLGGGEQINGERGDELAEVLRMGLVVHAVIDSERASAEAPPQATNIAFRDVCTQLKIDCHILDRRAIEHYLTADAIHSVKSTKYRALGPFEDFDAVEPRWAKNENWMIARKMSKADLSSTDLFHFLEQI